MKTLKYEIDIAAEPGKVWSTMLDHDTYVQWVKNAWPGSDYQGEFKQGAEISFAGPDGSGTLAKIDELKPKESVKATHIAILQPGGVRDAASDVAKGWVGTEENYYFQKKGANTHVTVEIKTSPDWAKMFDDTWPGALKDLKALCEK